MSSACRAVALVLALACVAQTTPSLVRAQAEPAVSGDEEARALFQAGRAAYAAGRYEEALGHFRRSHELSDRAELLYNVGQCLDRLRRDVEAVEAFEAYLAASPDAPERTEIEARLAILRAQVAQDAARATPEPEPAAPVDEAPAETLPIVTPSASREPDVLPWVLVGAGAAVAVAGGILLGVGLADKASIENGGGVPFTDVRSQYDGVPILTGVGGAALGVGAALAGVGVVLAVTGGGSQEQAQVRLGPTSITVSGSF